MKKITVTLFQNGKRRALKAEPGELLSNVLQKNGVRSPMPCGGKGICKGCEALINGEKKLICATALEADTQVVLSVSGLQNIAEGKILPKRGPDPMYQSFGLAVDVGTTTLCASLISHSGEAVTVTAENPQTVFGADVISRIEKALYGGGAALAGYVREAVSGMADKLCRLSGISQDRIDAAVITGNTAMLYLLTGRSPETLSRAPFDADCLFGQYIPAKALGFSFSEGAQVYLPRCAAAFVGGDITTAVIACGMCGQNGSSLLIDVGTNGEIALWHEGELTCCSTAAGPAFEGAGITCGMYGASGAIDHVWHEDGVIRVSTIGGGHALGICGSGITDALSVMLELGVIDETGAFTGGSDSFPLQDGIHITAGDVRKIQLAKGSVRAGLETLLETAATPKAMIRSLYIAGGFGSYLNLENASSIGLIPRELLPSANVAGNAAHTGAVMLLQDKALVSFSEKMAAGCKALALDANPVFTENYINYMMFEE
ncbi:MAG: ASKHA domain-containing protein [Oscillospiraceae bacterium]|nr:ASKHA domain-containing protein [Oscillospiraceae bacterium]